MRITHLLLGLAALGAARPAAAQWSCDPLLPLTLSTHTGPESALSSGSTSANGFFAAWRDADVRCQFVDADGAQRFAPGGLVVQTIASPLTQWSMFVDAADTAVFTVLSGGLLRVHRIDAAGQALWGQGGVVVAPLAEWARTFALPNGTYTVVWSELGQLRCQRLSALGVSELAAGGVPLGGPGGAPADIAAAPNGDLLALWNAAPQPGLRLERFDPNGQAVWPAPRIFGISLGFDVVLQMELAAGGDGSALVTWSTLDIITCQNRLHYQAVDPQGVLSGAELTLAKGLPCDALESIQGLQYEPTGDALTVWWSPAPGELWAARIGAGGVPLWSDGSQPAVLVSSHSEQPARHVHASDGRSLFAVAEPGQGLSVVQVGADGALLGGPSPAISFAGQGVREFTCAIDAEDRMLCLFVDPLAAASVEVRAHVVAGGGIGGPPPSALCEPSASGLGCAPQIGSSGQPSFLAASPFVITATGIASAKNGSLFYGVSGPLELPFGNGKLCVKPPVRHTPLQFSGGGLAPSCNGTFAFDFADWLAHGANTLLAPGVTVHAQYRYRDGSNPSGFGLTDALVFYLCP